jgi:phosphate butyryltransferase
MKKDFRILFEKAKRRGRKRFAVTGAAGVEVLRAAARSAAMGLMDPVLIGPEPSIRKCARLAGVSLRNMPVVHADDEPSMAEHAVRMAACGEAEALMKGNISTPVMLKTVLDAGDGLRSGGLLSHIALMDVPSFSKWFVITDSGMVIRPTLEQKMAILDNALAFVRRLGVKAPRVAILAANEKVSPHMPETQEALSLAQMGLQGRFGNAVVEGPMALDMAFSRQSAAIKGIPSRVAGRPDILLVPDIASGNIFAKGLVYLAHAKISGLIVGARVPIVLISRSERAETWLRSIALANLMC